MTPSKTSLVALRAISRKRHIIRGNRVLLDSDLAELYGVPTKRPNEQVRRNKDRFSKDFMFELTKKEAHILRSQFATSKPSAGGRRYLPYVFTEQGVAMLSSAWMLEHTVTTKKQGSRFPSNASKQIPRHETISNSM